MKYFWPMAMLSAFAFWVHVNAQLFSSIGSWNDLNWLGMPMPHAFPPVSIGLVYLIAPVSNWNVIVFEMVTLCVAMFCEYKTIKAWRITI